MPDNTVIRIAILTSMTIAWVAHAHAQTPVAIVEHVKSKTAGVEMMDYLSPGKVMKLGPNDSMVLGYLKSCWQETIVSGTVTIGPEQSEVSNGKVDRGKVPCDSNHITLSTEQARKSGGMAFRKGPQKGGALEPELTLYGLSPVIESKVAGRLVIERLDQKGEKIELDIAGPQMLRGAFFDLAKADKALVAGGVYRASLGSGRQLVFKVDPLAKPGAGPVIGRLLRFPSAT